MPNLNTYLDWHDSGNAEDWLAQFSRDPAFMIGHRGTSVVLYRNGSARPAQDLLIAPLGRSSTTEGANNDTGRGARDELLVLGMADADIRKGDEFAYNSESTRRNYRVAYVEKAIFGQVQARAEQVQ